MPREGAWECAKKVLARTLVEGASVREDACGRRALRCVTQCHKPVVNASINFYQLQLFSASAGRAGSDGAAKIAIATDASRAGTGQEILDKAPQSRLGPGRRITRTGRDRRAAGSTGRSRACYYRAAPPGAPCRELSQSLPEPSTQRDLRLDFFRGLSLIFIFIDHIPYNVLSYFTLQSNTFFDAAEVFIFISGYTAALVYGRRLAAKGAIYATAQIWRRAWTLYVAHIFLFVLFIAEVS